MTVGTYGAQIPYRVDLVFAPDLGQRSEMVNVDEAFTNLDGQLQS
jgi:hypothetical protein